jgi:hypothetical protein
VGVVAAEVAFAFRRHRVAALAAAVLHGHPRQQPGPCGGEAGDAAGGEPGPALPRLALPWEAASAEGLALAYVATGDPSVLGRAPAATLAAARGLAEGCGLPDLAAECEAALCAVPLVDL